MTKNLMEMICSSRSDNDLQGELIDLLGVELFELAIEILEKRNKICYEIKSKALQKATEARQNKSKVSFITFYSCTIDTVFEK